jgi:hypothetical protein
MTRRVVFSVAVLLFLSALCSSLALSASSSSSSGTKSSSSSRRSKGDCAKQIDEKIRKNQTLAKKFEMRGDVCEALIHLRLALRNVEAVDSSCEKPGQQESLLRYAKSIKQELDRLEPKGKDCQDRDSSGGVDIQKEDGVTVIRKK